MTHTQLQQACDPLCFFNNRASEVFRRVPRLTWDGQDLVSEGWTGTHSPQMYLSTEKWQKERRVTPQTPRRASRCYKLPHHHCVNTAVDFSPALLHRGLVCVTKMMREMFHSHTVTFLLWHTHTHLLPSVLTAADGCYSRGWEEFNEAEVDSCWEIHTLDEVR